MDIKKIDQAGFISITGINRSTVSLWMNGHQSIGLKNCRVIAESFGCDPYWVKDGTGEPFTQPKKGEIAATLGHWKHKESKQEETDKEAPTTEINIQDGLSMTEMVLLSNTSYADVLWANIKSFAKSVETEKDMNELKENMREMERKISDKMERMENLLLSLGATEQQKRDKAANS